jgi:hypothetical protein
MIATSTPAMYSNEGVPVLLSFAPSALPERRRSKKEKGERKKGTRFL